MRLCPGMDGIPQGAREGGAVCPGMDGIPQGNRPAIRLWPFFLLIIALNPLPLAAAPATIDYQPFEIRDQNVFNLIHGQAMPTNARLLKKNETRWSTSLIITNALNIESSANESIYLDYEAYRFNFAYLYGLNEHWNLKLDVPVIRQTGGFFDSGIDSWHEFFGLPRANRPLIDDNQYQVNYSSQSQTQLSLNEASTSLGDIQLAAARSLIDNDSTSMSLWAGIKLPTGDEDKLSGNGATDFSAWLALNQLLADSWVINLNTGIVLPGKDNYKNIPLSEQVFYGHVMLGWLVTDNINIKAQLQGHTSYYDNSQLKILGNSYFLSVGAAIKISQCQQLDIALSEDIKVDASPDASFLISWRSYSAGC